MKLESIRSLLIFSLPCLFISIHAVGFDTFENDPVWMPPVLNFQINPNFPDLALSGTPDEQEEILLCGTNAWIHQSQANISINYQGRSGLTGVINDGINNVSWIDMDGGTALAATLVGRDTANGEILSFDMVFFSSTNGEPNNWNGPRDTTPGKWDLQGVAIHEFGHALGLLHSAILDSTMFTSVRGLALPFRTLHQDDIDGIQFLYPPLDPPVHRNNAPVLEMVEPNFGTSAGGNEVVLRGNNFTWTSDTLLQSLGTIIPTSSYNIEMCNLIRIHDMPAHSAGVISLTITNELGVHTLLNAYTYGDPPPQILSIEPTQGPILGAIPMTILGQNLRPDLVAEIDGVPLLDQQFVDGQTITGILPESSQSGSVDATLVQGGFIIEHTLANAFTYIGDVMSLEDSTGAPGQSGVPVKVNVTNEDSLLGFSFACTYDNSMLDVDQISVVDTVSAAAEFFDADIDNENGVSTFSLSMSLFDLTPTIASGTLQHAATILTSISGDAVADSEIALELEDGIGSPPIDLLFSPVIGPPFQPETLNASITVLELIIFLRGDANLSGGVNIADAVFLLSYLFGNGAPPGCEKSADANDDSKLNIADAIYVLTYLFASGAIPPEPFPDPGVDPTEDGLSCEA